MPEKFDLSYIDEDGKKARPVVIHRAIFGSLDRFIAFLLEETKGVLPLWLAPVQISILPVNNEYHLDYANEVYDELKKHFKVELNNKDEKLSYRMREVQTSKIPCTIILGDNEKENNLISYRLFGSKETNTVTKEQFINFLNDKIDSKQ